VAEFDPLISGKWLTFLYWFFIILAIGSVIWYFMYLTSSKKRIAKTTAFGFIITSTLLAFAIQMILVKEEIIIL